MENKRKPSTFSYKQIDWGFNSPRQICVFIFFVAYRHEKQAPLCPPKNNRNINTSCGYSLFMIL